MLTQEVARLIKSAETLERLASGHAAKVGPLHAWWDTIFDVRQAILDVRRAREGK